MSKFFIINSNKIFIKQYYNSTLLYRQFYNRSSLFIKSQERPFFLPKRLFKTHKGEEEEVPQWKGIVTRFVPIGICLIAVMQWRAYRKNEKNLVTEVAVDCYRMMPLNIMSRMFGYIGEVRIPELLRPIVYGMFVWLAGINMQEAANPDLKSYDTLCDLFVRTLKDGARKVDDSSLIVSPCDGTILCVCKSNCDKIEQIKGVTYSIKQFIGDDLCNLIKKKTDGSETVIYQCIIYLSPRDYHRFHSPTEWRPDTRRHYHGELLSVNPFIVRHIPGVFASNERVVYLGEWEHGFFSFAAIGATNVGSIRMYFDKDLKTNCSNEPPCVKQKIIDINVKRGDMIGEFRFGSTIVLLLEAPKGFTFSVKPGEKVRMGQPLCTVND